MFSSGVTPTEEDEQLLEASQHLSSGFKTVIDRTKAKRPCTNCFSEGESCFAQFPFDPHIDLLARRIS